MVVGGRTKAFVDVLNNCLPDCKLLKVGVVNSVLVLDPKLLKTDDDVTDTVVVGTVLPLGKKGKVVGFAPVLVVFEKAIKLVVVLAGADALLEKRLVEPPVNEEVFKLANADEVVFAKFEFAFNPKPLKKEFFVPGWAAVLVEPLKGPNARVVVGAAAGMLCPKNVFDVDVAVFVEAGKIELFGANPPKVELLELKLNI